MSMFTDQLSIVAMELVSFCYTLPIPKSMSESLVSKFNSYLLSSPVTSLLNDINKLQVDMKNSELGEISSKLTLFQLSLNHYNSENKVSNFLRQSNCYVEPSAVKSYPTLSIPKCLQSCVSIRIGQVFKSFFECPNILKVATNFQEYCKSSQNGTIFHFLQSPTWQKFRILNQAIENDDSFLMPLFLYYDDYESKNPLGSHKGIHKLGGVYISVPSFPPEIESKIGNLFLSSIFHTLLRGHLGYSELFKHLVEALNLLNSNGILVFVNGKKFTIKFQLSQVLGDNLGLNALAGYVECFTAHHYCRVCKAPINLCQSLCSENPEFARNRENFSHDIFCGDPSLTGLKEYSFLNQIPHFHVVEHLTLDVMHDILEGIARYEMKLIISDLVSKGFFSLETLNIRLRSFKFDSFENRPPPFSKDLLAKETLVLSASEMYCLVAYFGLLVGDLVPKHDKSWELYVLLRQISAISMSHHVKKNTPEHLKVLIVQHHTLYLEQSEGSGLKPKHHFLTHYPTKMANVGPLRHLSSFRYEALHKIFKRTAKNSSNTVNLPLTLASKFQMDQAFHFKSAHLIPAELVLGQPVEFFVESSYYLQLTNELELNKYSAMKNSQLFKTYGSAEYRCFVYQQNRVIVTNFDEFGPCFSIIECLLSDGINCIILSTKLNSPYFDSHYQAYKVEKSTNIHLVDCKDLAVKKCYMLMKNVKGECFVCPKVEL